MIPLRDDLPTPRFTPVVSLLLVANLLAFGWELLNPNGLQWAVFAYGAVPQEVWTFRDAPPEGLVPPPFTVFTAMFLHGGVAHLAFNLLFLAIFGNDVEQALGPARFLAFYLLAGTAAALAQVVLGGLGSTPMVGASGAIAGVLGAFLLLFPRAQVLTLVPIVVFLQFLWLPATLFLVLWFVVQILNSAAGGGGVAWYAHIGGFLAGLALTPLLAPRRSRRAAWPVRRYRWS